MGGYPRNEVFFDPCIREKVRAEQGLQGKKVYAYMPTFRSRDPSSGGTAQADFIRTFFEQADLKLDDSEVLFVHLHYYIDDFIRYSDYRHIRPFPAEIEPYEFLTAADVLISDYSSVMYDFSISHTLFRSSILGKHFSD